MANKRQALTETDLLSIVESTEVELKEACRQLHETSDKILDGTFSAGEFERLIKAGSSHKASTVLIKDQPAFVLIHATNAVGWLIIEGSVRIGKAPLRHLFEAGYALARHIGAPQILFVTKIATLYKYAKKIDFKTIGVVLCKPTPK